MPGDRQPGVRNALEEPGQFLERVRGAEPAVPPLADDFGMPSQQPGLQQGTVPLGMVQALPRPVDHVVDDEHRLAGRALDARQPGGAHQQVESVDVRVRLLKRPLQPHLNGPRQALVDLGQHPPAQLVHRCNRHLAFLDERQEGTKVVEYGAGAVLVDREFQFPG